MLQHRLLPKVVQPITTVGIFRMAMTEDGCGRLAYDEDDCICCYVYDMQHGLAIYQT